MTLQYEFVYGILTSKTEVQMPFERKRPLIILDREETSYLQELSRSRTEAAQRVE